MKFFIFLLILLSPLASAEQSVNFDNYTVHYIAVNSNFISPEIAAEYNIVRGNRRAFLNISIIRNEEDGSTRSVTADVSGGKKNLLGQVGNIDFIKIEEGEAIYYIGQFSFSNAENVKFEVEVQPEFLGKSNSIEWRTTMYNN